MKGFLREVHPYDLLAALHLAANRTPVSASSAAVTCTSARELSVAAAAAALPAASCSRAASCSDVSRAAPAPAAASPADAGVPAIASADAAAAGAAAAGADATVGDGGAGGHVGAGAAAEAAAAAAAATSGSAERAVAAATIRTAAASLERYTPALLPPPPKAEASRACGWTSFDSQDVRNCSLASSGQLTAVHAGATAAVARCVQSLYITGRLTCAYGSCMCLEAVNGSRPRAETSHLGNC